MDSTILEKTIVANKLVIGFTAVAILGVGAVAIALNQNKSSQTNESISNTSPTVTPTQLTTASPSNTTPSTVSGFKDGSYSAEGQYFSPGGQQHIAVSLTLQDGTITAVTVTPKPSDRESREYQNLFAQGISAKVVGKKITEANVGRVSGSSLTSQGFNEALQKIQEQAKQS